VQDDIEAIRAAASGFLRRGVPERHRSDMHQGFLASLAHLDTAIQPTPELVRALYGKGQAS
jgi:hypothetical protein